MASKSGNVRVQTAKYIAICQKLGLAVEMKAGWFLAYAKEAKSKRLLVHTGKKGTNCVELVGFESEFAIPHPCPPAKTMTQMLLHSAPMSEKEILRNFFKTAKLLVPVQQEVKEEPTQAPVEQAA